MRDKWSGTAKRISHFCFHEGPSWQVRSRPPRFSVWHGTARTLRCPNMSKLQCNLLTYTKVYITFSLQNMNDKFDCSFCFFFFFTIIQLIITYYLMLSVRHSKRTDRSHFRTKKGFAQHTSSRRSRISLLSTTNLVCLTSHSCFKRP